MIAPDMQIVEFSLLGVNYLYEGSKPPVIITDGIERVPIAEQLNEILARSVTQHIPADEQIRSALNQIGIPASAKFKIQYASDQPDDNLPDGAIY
jgi:hypothetical protein